MGGAAKSPVWTSTSWNDVFKIYLIKFVPSSDIESELWDSFQDHLDNWKHSGIAKLRFSLTVQISIDSNKYSRILDFFLCNVIVLSKENLLIIP